MNDIDPYVTRLLRHYFLIRTTLKIYAVSQWCPFVCNESFFFTPPSPLRHIHLKLISLGAVSACCLPFRMA
jgi:hypothetical protein